MSCASRTVRPRNLPACLGLADSGGGRRTGLSSTRADIIKALEGWGYELRLIGTWDYLAVPAALAPG